MKKLLTLIVISALISSRSYAQPANEVRCMDNFDYTNTGNSKVNAYLLSMLNLYIYPGNILNKPDADPAVRNLHASPAQFKSAYETKVGHYFFDPNKPLSPIASSSIKSPITTKFPGSSVGSNINLTLNKKAIFDFIALSNNSGVDPEAMVISTDNYIIVVFRGTDRVGGAAPSVGDLGYNYGEWIQTSLNFPMEAPPPNFGFTKGKVHRGFNRSVLFTPLGSGVSFLDSLVNTLKLRGVANKKLWITGHSLGSACATLAAAYMKKAKGVTPYMLYLYASPHPCDQDMVVQVNTLFPGTTLQRFDFIDDPITKLPLYSMGAGRCGIRNRYSKESGSSNYFFNTNEDSNDGVHTFFCLHHPHWYSRAAGFELLDHSPEMASKVPSMPAKPSEFCSFLDYDLAEGKETIGATLFGNSEDIEPGTYYIRNGKSLKYLSVPTQLTDQNGAIVELHDLTSSTGDAAKWIVSKVKDAVVGGYTIKLKKNGKYLDADFLSVNNNGCKIQLWNRSINPDKRNQEWSVKRLNNGRFEIKNLMGVPSKYLHVPSGTANTEGVNTVLNNKLTQSNQEWFFVKVQ